LDDSYSRVSDHRSSFELYRNQLRDLDLVSFDELAHVGCALGPHHGFRQVMGAIGSSRLAISFWWWSEGISTVSKECIAKRLVCEQHLLPAVHCLGAFLVQGSNLFAVLDDPRKIPRGAPPRCGLRSHVAEVDLYRVSTSIGFG
jgi:hypothetical protein